MATPWLTAAPGIGTLEPAFESRERARAPWRHRAIARAIGAPSFGTGMTAQQGTNESYLDLRPEVVEALSGGRTVEASIALLDNNAGVAAQIARADAASAAG